ncbi:MAG: F0F1 ATP synthase subunit A [Chloroflexi bacterium]|nr:F0F1 ATP synthase subunit A [Chloroflexota bacterium]
MSRLLRNPRVLTALIVFAVLFIIAIAGGALGAAFDLGFLGAPLAVIQLPAESVIPGELFLGWTITNTMVATWITIIVLALFSYFATRNIKDVPGRLQGLAEVVIEFFIKLAESIAGPERARRFLPLVLTIFIFIVTSNWLGILPGFGSIGRVEPAEELIEHEVEEAAEEGREPNLEGINLQTFEKAGPFLAQGFGSVNDELTAEEWELLPPAERPEAGHLVPYFRSANTDVNTPLAIALIAMFMVQFWGIRQLGFSAHLGKFINLKQGAIGFFVGILELISEFAKIISFTFRLFGNIFAGEVLLIAMAFLLPLIGLIPFLGLELFVGIIQAFIFAMLTLVFATAATAAHGGGEHGEAGHH